MLLELLTCSEIGDDHEELQLNVVAACTNLTFYTCRGVSSNSLNLSFNYFLKFINFIFRQ